VKILFKNIAAALLSGLLMGGVLGAAEFLVFMWSYGAHLFVRADMIPFFVNYSVHWGLAMILSGIVCGLIFRKVNDWGALFFRYLTWTLLGGIAIYSLFKLSLVFREAPNSAKALSAYAALFGVAVVLGLIALVISLRISPRKGTAFFTVVLILFLASAGAGFWPEGKADTEVAKKSNKKHRNNVLFILVDTLRADHLGCYGYDRPVSPAIDRFAEEGIRFSRCIAASSWTRPSTASILTGMFPASHAQHFLFSVIPNGTTMIPDAMGQYGYRTAFVCSNPVVGRSDGFAQDVDFYKGCDTKLGTSLSWFLTVIDKTVVNRIGLKEPVAFALFKTVRDAWENPEREKLDAGWLNEKFLTWLDRAPKAPFFAYLHYTDPHTPYDPPASYTEMFKDPAYNGPDLEEPPFHGDGFPPVKMEEKVADEKRDHLRNKYDAEIRCFDDFFAELLEGLKSRGVLDNTMIVFTSDHGEGFYEHGAWRHGHTLFQEVVHVPLILRLPGNESGGQVIDGLCSHVDLVPTILELLNLPPWPQLQGASLVPAIKGADSTPEEMWALSDIRALDNPDAYCRSYIEGQRKLIYIKDEKEHWFFYDLSRDPEEQNPIVDENDEAMKSMIESLKEKWRFAGSKKLDTMERTISKEDRQRLRELGY